MRSKFLRSSFGDIREKERERAFLLRQAKIEIEEKVGMRKSRSFSGGLDEISDDDLVSAETPRSLNPEREKKTATKTKVKRKKFSSEAKLAVADEMITKTNKVEL